MFCLFVQMAKDQAEHSWRSAAETASVLWLVNKQHKMDS